MMRVLLPIVAFVFVCASCLEQGPPVGTPLTPPSDKTDMYPQTDVGRLLKNSYKAEKVIDILWDTTFNVTNGLDYYQFQLLTYDREKLDTYLLRVDPSKDLELKVGVSKQTTPYVWYEQVLTEMAADMSTLSNPVYAMVNGDFCDNRKPIRPRGPVHSDGEILAQGYSQDPDYKHQGLSYLGVTFDGKMTIGATENYESAKSTLKECTGGGVILIKDYEIQGGLVVWNTSRDPRTAVGYTSDNIVWILAVDGRHKGTEGMNYIEMASIFRGLECQDAVNLDGGGSTEMIVRHPYSGTMMICNWPSDPTDGDGGVERERPTTWAVVKK